MCWEHRLERIGSTFYTLQNLTLKIFLIYGLLIITVQQIQAGILMLTLKSQKGQRTDQKIVFTLCFFKSGLSALTTSANSWSSSPSLVTVKLMSMVWACSSGLLWGLASLVWRMRQKFLLNSHSLSSILVYLGRNKMHKNGDLTQLKNHNYLRLQKMGTAWSRQHKKWIQTKL